MALPFAGLGLPEQAMGWFPLRFGIGSRRYRGVDLLNFHASLLSEEDAAYTLMYHYSTLQ